MGGIHTSFVSSAHGYTRSKTPWILNEHKSAYGKLIHYISGGGMRTFGRTVSQEEAHRKHVRFFVTSAVLFAVWLVFYVA